MMAVIPDVDRRSLGGNVIHSVGQDSDLPAMNHDTSMKRAMHFNATVHVSIMFIR